MIKRYLKYIFNILKFYDVQPLLLFWCASDILNNQILWTDYQYWFDLGQPNTYYLYCVYMLVSIGIFTSMRCIKRCSYFVSAYLFLTLFATIRYIVSLVTDETKSFDMEAFRALTITFFYLLIWIWIWVKLKREMLYRKLKK
tara:strand:- start:1781 stop:2206 length:426 start_codon:yes stop_codon:yes gene_type:complete